MLAFAEEVVLVLSTAVILVLTVGNVFSRKVIHQSWSFTEELFVADKYGKEVADNCSILYGGSCKPSNAKELFANPDVDGGLIGGAALKVSDFKGIIDAFN